MSNLVSGNIGSVGSYDVSFSAGSLVVKASASEGAFSQSVSISLDSGKVLDAISAAIPNGLVDEAISLIKAELAKVS